MWSGVGQASSLNCPSILVLGFPGSDGGKEPACQCRRRKTHRFDSWVGKIPWGNGIATRYSILTWRIPWTEEPGVIQSIGLQRVRVRHEWSKLAHTHILRAGEGNGNPFQCSCLETPRDGGAWWADIYGIAQSWTQLKRLSSSQHILRVSIHREWISNHFTLGEGFI